MTTAAISRTESINLVDFIEEVRDQLCEQTTGLLAPQYTGAQHEKIATRLATMQGRPFLSTQVDIAAALALGLEQVQTAYGIGEQGVGKSQIGLGTAYLLKAKRVLIVAPPHMVPAWQMEIAQVWPTATVKVIRKRSDLPLLREDATPLIAILSREHAKLGSMQVPGTTIRKKLQWVQRDNGQYERIVLNIVSCPHCGTYLYKQVRQEKIWFLNPEQAPLTCPECTAPLWTVKNHQVHGGAAYRRVPLAQQILRYHRHFFDLAIVDEIHEYEGANTWQGRAFGHIVQACKKTLTLTGTLFGGYSSSLFPLLWKTNQAIREEFDYGGVGRWINLYGLWDRTTRTKWEERPLPSHPGRTEIVPKIKTDVRERPGAAPALLLPLLDRTAFVRISDLNIHLPPYREEILNIEMSQEQQKAYAQFQSWVMPSIKSALASKRWKAMAIYMTSLMTWPDRCWVEEPLEHHPTWLTHGGSLPPVLNHGTVYPKERLLIERVIKERAEGRKVIIYASHTGKRDITARLAMLLDQHGIANAILTAKTKPAARIAWFAHQATKVDAVICQPRLVATGLTLNDFPTLIYMEPESSTFIFRQSSRRSWRIGQTKDVRIFCLNYIRSVQEQAWILLARKVKAALLLEGDIDSGTDGLATFDAEGEFLVELAKQITAKGAGNKDSLQQLFHDCRRLEVDLGILKNDPVPVPPVPTPSVPLRTPCTMPVSVRTPHPPEQLALF